MKTRLNDDDEDMIVFDGAKVYKNYQRSCRLTFPIDTPILEPSHYQSALHEIRSLDETDQLIVVVNTPGGRIDSAVSIVNVLQSTKADVVCVLEQAYSAGTFFVLASPTVVVTENATMMFHNYSSGFFGKGGELVTGVNFQDSFMKKLMTKYYKGFLTDKELERLFKGEDFYMEADEIMQRLHQRQAFLQKKPKRVKHQVPKLQYNPDDVAFKGKD
jgi:ATP-dependent protease ClpP protease subunit